MKGEWKSWVLVFAVFFAAGFLFAYLDGKSLAKSILLGFAFPVLLAGATFLMAAAARYPWLWIIYSIVLVIAYAAYPS